MTPDVRVQLRAMADHAAREIHKGLVETLDSPYVQPFESPIEALFFGWWMVLDRLDYCEHFTLSPQREVAAGGHTYRLDFVVRPDDLSTYETAWHKGARFQDIAVELDGHEWHERTPEQVAYRNRRDRDLQVAGWKVFHFSGSEIVRRPVACITEVREYAARVWVDMLGMVRGNESAGA